MACSYYWKLGKILLDKEPRKADTSDPLSVSPTANSVLITFEMNEKQTKGNSLDGALMQLRFQNYNPRSEELQKCELQTAMPQSRVLLKQS